MLNLFKLLLVYFIISFFSPAFGEEKKSPENEIIYGYSLPGRIEVNQEWDFFFTASFIYMQAMEEIDLAIANSATLPRIQGKIIDHDFTYKPGFRVGMGYNLPHDHWDIYAEYTRFHQTSTTKASAPSNGNLLTLLLSSINQGTANGVLGRWKLAIDMLDVELARSGHVSKSLILRPYLGLRALWIDQKYTAQYLEMIQTANNIFSPQVNSITKNDSWAIGPKFGMDTDWLIVKNLRFFGNISGCLIFTSDTSNHKENSITNNFPVVSIRDDTNFIRPNLELAVGLGWGTYFKDCRYHIDLSADYEFQAFWNQNMFQLTSFSFNGGGVDLFLHGLGIRVRFDF